MEDSMNELPKWDFRKGGRVSEKRTLLGGEYLDMKSLERIER